PTWPFSRTWRSPLRLGIPMELLRRMFRSIGGAELSQISSYCDLAGVVSAEGHPGAPNNSSTLGQGSGAGVVNRGPYLSLIRLQIPALTRGPPPQRPPPSAMPRKFA